MTEIANVPDPDDWRSRFTAHNEFSLPVASESPIKTRFEGNVAVKEGGAIALGHPLGATGAMIFGTVLDELERRDLNTALVTLCIGAGMGTATIIERV